MQEFLAQDLMHAHPPMIGDRNKRTGFGTSAPRTSVFSNTGRGMPYPCPEAPGLTCKGVQQCVGTTWFLTTSAPSFFRALSNGTSTLQT
jgi:hypothetical protein